MVQLPAAGDFLDADRIVSGLGLQPGSKVADFGCGSGFFSIALAKAVGSDGRVSAVDVMTEPLESVHTRSEAMGLQNIDTIRADLEVLGGTKLADASQDLVLLKNVLFQSKKQESILAEAARVLKPQGKIVIIDWVKGQSDLGPPDELRVDAGRIRQECEKLGMNIERDIAADKYHFGFIAIK